MKIPHSLQRGIFWVFAVFTGLIAGSTIFRFNRDPVLPFLALALVILVSVQVDQKQRRIWKEIDAKKGTVPLDQP